MFIIFEAIGLYINDKRNEQTTVKRLAAMSGDVSEIWCKRLKFYLFFFLSIIFWIEKYSTDRSISIPFFSPSFVDDFRIFIFHWLNIWWMKSEPSKIASIYFCDDGFWVVKCSPQANQFIFSGFTLFARQKQKERNRNEIAHSIWEICFVCHIFFFGLKMHIFWASSRFVQYFFQHLVLSFVHKTISIDFVNVVAGVSQAYIRFYLLSLGPTLFSFLSVAFFFSPFIISFSFQFSVFSFHFVFFLLFFSSKHSFL